MHFKFSAAVVALMGAVAAKEMAVNQVVAEEFYDSGLVHEKILSLKKGVFADQEAAGAYNSAQYRAIDYKVECVNGLATAVQGDAKNTFRCKNADLYSFLSHAELGSTSGEGSSSWGWTSSTGREFVAIGQYDGTAFAEITSEGKLVYLGRLPYNGAPSEWREIRGYNDYMVIGSEASNHYIQIFDMKKLLSLSSASPKVFNKDNDITGLFTGLPSGRSHNVVTNPASGFAYAVGAMPRTDKCRSGLIFINMTDPSNPTNAGCNAADGYVHDAQCVIYKGPDTKYVGREICYGYNEDSLTIYDVTDKANSKVLSRTSYSGYGYTHQGWVLDLEWQQYLLLDDELDEYATAGADGYPTTFIWDVSSLEAPKQTGKFKNTRVKAIDHNQYVKDGFTYQSNYGAGLSVWDVRSVPKDPTGASVKEVAYFDIYPEDDTRTGGGSASFVGTWSSYPYFKSGYIFINTIERGGWVVKLKPEALV